MYDIWYAMEIAIMRPTLVGKIGQPAFTFVRRQLIETDSNGNVVFQTNGSPSTGNIDETDSAAVRVTIANFVKGFSASAPPISLYCAGRFCQMVNIAQFDTNTPGDTSFQAIVNLYHSAYASALGSGTESSLDTFPAFLGLMAFDSTLVSEMNPVSARLPEVLDEFGIALNSREWDIASEFGADPNFGSAFQLLMEGNANPWLDNPTNEPIFFWDNDHSSHLV